MKSFQSNDFTIMKSKYNENDLKGITCACKPGYEGLRCEKG